MARLAPLVVPGLPHHVTQRGSRRERVFFEDDDHKAYLALIAAARRSSTAGWSYCLMPNHVHFIMAPSQETACGSPSPRRSGAILTSVG